MYAVVNFEVVGLAPGKRYAAVTYIVPNYKLKMSNM
jgi:hypothetical protein